MAYEDRSNPAAMIMQFNDALERSLQAMRSQSPEDQLKQRDAMVDRIYNDFQRAAEKDTVLPYSVFKKFEILYDAKLREKALNNDIDLDLQNQLEELSQEFMTLVHPCRPIHIVDDITGEEICPPLAPLRMKLTAISGEDSHVMDMLSSAIMHNDGNVAGVNAVKLDKALHGAAMSFIQTQNNNRDALFDQVRKAKEVMNAFDKEVTDPKRLAYMKEQGLLPTTDTELRPQQQVQAPKQEVHVDNINMDDFVDFEPIPSK